MMSRSSLNKKAEKIKELEEMGRYMEAAEAADDILWEKSRDARLLSRISGVYEKCGRYQDAKDVLLTAYNRTSVGKNIIYRLAKLSALLGDVDDAEKFYWEFRDLAPKDSRKLILAYYVICAREEPDSKKIQVLEKYVKIDFDDRWAYTLAQLYYSEEQTEKCIKICDEIILWYSGSEYGNNALKLKHKCMGVQEENEINIEKQPVMESGQSEEETECEVSEQKMQTEDVFASLGEADRFEEILECVRKASENNEYNYSKSQGNILFWDLKSKKANENNEAEASVNISENETAATAEEPVHVEENTEALIEAAEPTDIEKDAEDLIEEAEESTDIEKDAEDLIEEAEELTGIEKDAKDLIEAAEPTGVEEDAEVLTEAAEDAVGIEKDTSDIQKKPVYVYGDIKIDDYNYEMQASEKDAGIQVCDGAKEGNASEIGTSEYTGTEDDESEIRQKADVGKNEGFDMDNEDNIPEYTAEDELAATAAAVWEDDIGNEEQTESLSGIAETADEADQKYKVIGYLDEQNIFNAAESILNENEEAAETKGKNDSIENNKKSAKTKKCRRFSKQGSIKIYLMECSQMRGSVKYAANKLKNIHQDTGTKSSGVAKISDTKLSIKGFENTINVLKGRDLVVEGVTDITYESVNEMVRLMDGVSKPMIIVLLDTPTKLALFINRHRTFAEKCTYFYEEAAITRAEFIEYVNSYAYKLNAVLDDTANEALEDIADEIIEDGLLFTASDAAEIADKAIQKALKPGIRGVFEAKKDAEGYLILRARHFSRG